MAVTDLMGLVTATITPQASVEAMLTDITAALNAHGVFSRTLLHAGAAPNPTLLEGLLLLMRDSGMPGLILNCNVKDELVLEQRDGRPLTVHDAWNMPMVGFLVDHPAYHLPSLLRAPEKALITVIDEGHLGFLKDIGLPKQATLFCPHGGPPPLPVQRMAADRPIDLLFIGNIGAEPPLGLWLDRNAAGDAGLRQILAEAHDAVREDGEEPYAALVAALGRAGRGMAMTEIAGLVVTLEGFVARSRRLQVLKAIRSRRVTILGTVAPEAVAELAHHDLRGAQSFAKGLSLMAGTKILLNSRMTFARGAHERVFYGLSRGAVVATEPSSFLAAELAAGLGMLGLPKEEDAIDRVLDGMLADPAALDACREQGLAHYARHHTWVERVGRMLGALAEAQLIG